jgi:hypothetical protein
VILFFSVLLPIVQYQKWQRAVGYLRHATINNLGLKNGGSKGTLELFRRAEEQYKLRYQDNGTTGNGRKGKNDKIPSGSKMLKDPLFSTIVDDVVGEVKIEGGYKKPTYNDIFLVKLVLFPYNMYNWSMRKYKIAYYDNELTDAECLELTIESIGLGTWDDMSPIEQENALQRRLWQTGKLEAFEKDREEEYLRKNPALFKRYNRHKKKEKMG